MAPSGRIALVWPNWAWRRKPRPPRIERQRDSLPTLRRHFMAGSSQHDSFRLRPSRRVPLPIGIGGVRTTATLGGDRRRPASSGLDAADDPAAPPARVGARSRGLPLPRGARRLLAVRRVRPRAVHDGAWTRDHRHRGLPTPPRDHGEQLVDRRPSEPRTTKRHRVRRLGKWSWALESPRTYARGRPSRQGSTESGRHRGAEATCGRASRWALRRRRNLVRRATTRLVWPTSNS
jgi:hypothetical protein